MIIILEKMIKETAIFFLLLIVIAAGFFQSFMASVPIITYSNCSLDSSDGTSPVILRMLNSMTQAFLNSPNFDYYESLRPPFGIVLFYLYASIVSICRNPSVLS